MHKLLQNYEIILNHTQRFATHQNFFTQERKPKRSDLEQIAKKLESNLHEILLDEDNEYSYIMGNTHTATTESISKNSSRFQVLDF